MHATGIPWSTFDTEKWNFLTLLVCFYRISAQKKKKKLKTQTFNEFHTFSEFISFDDNAQQYQQKEKKTFKD